MQIIPLQDKHLPEAEHLLREHGDIFSEKDIKNFKQDLISYLSLPRHVAEYGLTFIIEVDNIVCGIILYQKDQYSHNSYNIKWLIIKKDQQNKGYGTHLVNEVTKRIKKVGGKHIYLETSNERHNEHAKKFYEDLGFKRVGVLPDYYDSPMKSSSKLEDGILYHKEI